VPVSAGGSVRTSSGMLTVEMAREGIPITVIQRQLGHADLGVTSVYLRGIDNREIIETVHERQAPMMSANAGLRVGP
jgi:integrase